MGRRRVKREIAGDATTQPDIEVMLMVEYKCDVGVADPARHSECGVTDPIDLSTSEFPW
jgi:hypothetical protein